MIKNLLNYFAEPSDSAREDLKGKAKLSSEEVSNIAREVGIDEKWLPKYTQKEPCLKKENGKLLWTVAFVLETNEGFSMIGAHKSLIIEDETGLVIRKIAGNR